jgi:hypothetical protein
MQLIKLINKLPYLIYVAVLQLGLFFCLIIIYGGFVYGGGFVFRLRFWIVLLPSWLLIFLYVVVRGVFSLRAKGLKYSATVGELNDAMKRGQPG